MNLIVAGTIFLFIVGMLIALSIFWKHIEVPDIINKNMDKADEKVERAIVISQLKIKLLELLDHEANNLNNMSYVGWANQVLEIMKPWSSEKWRPVPVYKGALLAVLKLIDELENSIPQGCVPGWLSIRVATIILKLEKLDEKIN